MLGCKYNENVYRLYYYIFYYLAFNRLRGVNNNYHSTLKLCAFVILNEDNFTFYNRLYLIFINLFFLFETFKTLKN